MQSVAAEGQQQWKKEEGRTARAAARRSHSALVDIRRQQAADVKTLLRCHYLAGACPETPQSRLGAPAPHTVSPLSHSTAASPLRLWCINKSPEMLFNGRFPFGVSGA